ncbi:hypothetical protein ABL78_5738 [Leptomonas seymouri]|uniref:Uncharacterized protein n=1 Tax=Leptomonas seymouri TaxID=5684 RepID=A0A0N1PD93_LEPSE|nr:hypothetical protein ABL78_5738 [Leptomonas seymouri]|eukprot:KPI85193.1 hypothetical protein ABL78_5738 [Leptomonas seymouri]
MWRSGLVVAAMVVVALATAASAHDIQLPTAIYDNAAGEWSVEVLSSCRSPTYGTVKFQNTTARIEWEVGGAPDVLISGQSPDTLLSLAGLAEFMSKDGKGYSYKTCEHQENYLATPQRPQAVAHLSSSYMTMYTGVLSSSTDERGCTPSTDRNVVIQALGGPLKDSNKGQWRVQEALYSIEIVVETADLDGTCAHTQSAELAETALESKRRSRKRRTGRGFSSSSAAIEMDGPLAEHGIVTIRFIRRNAAASSWMVRYYTPIAFVTIMVAYRVVRSFVSTRAEKTPL